MTIQCLHEAQTLSHCLAVGQPWSVPPDSNVAWVSLPDPPQLPPQLANITREPPGPAPGQPSASLPCKVASGNVLTMEPGQSSLAKTMGLVQTAKMAHLQAQLIEASVDFFGIQEARTQGQEVRQMSDYTAITSGATAASTHG
eukprot:9814099-Lingulodinium_polyedra.AAC.1